MTEFRASSIYVCARFLSNTVKKEKQQNYISLVLKKNIILHTYTNYITKKQKM